MKLLQICFFLVFSTIALLGYTNRTDNKNEILKSAGIVEVSSETGNSSQAKSKAPDFKLKSIDGKEVKLSDYKGKIVVLDFWATWCGPCRMGIPDLVEIQKEYKDKLVVLGVSLDELSGTINDVKPFIKEFKINYPIILGTEKVTMDYGNIQAIPTSFIIDQEGNVVDKYVGLAPKEKYIKKIKSLLGKS